MQMFVWAMRDKGSEWRAMNKFLRAGRLPFTPIVEAVCEPFMAQEKRPAKHPTAVMSTLSRKIAPLTDSGRVWVDLCHLERMFSPSDVAEMLRFVRRNRELASHLIVPVIRTSSKERLMEAAMDWARVEGCGLCIRVDGLTSLAQKSEVVNNMVKSSGLADAVIDLILDAQDLPLAVSHDEMRHLFPLVHTARTWVVLAGTFPGSITQMDPDEYEHHLERREWLAWSQEVEREGDWRRPIYGDYATQAALYTPSAAFPGSPSVRYSTADQYVILRGRGNAAGNGVDCSQFVGHARFLRRQSYFRDVVATRGDAYVDRIAMGKSGTGTATTWRVASLDRHVSLVAAQVAQYSPVFAGAPR